MLPVHDFAFDPTNINISFKSGPFLSNCCLFECFRYDFFNITSVESLSLLIAVIFEPVQEVTIRLLAGFCSCFVEIIVIHDHTQFQQLGVL